MKSLTKILSMLACGVCIAATGSVSYAQPAVKVVNVAYQGTYSPWIKAMVDGTFEQRTGYKIKWQKFNSGAAVMTAMASGDIDIGVVGSSPLAAAASRGVDAQLFWILEDIADAESLMVRDGSGIKSPQDLIGKAIAVPVASTSHYQLMYMLEKWGITNKVKLLNMSPEQSAAAWERGDIDGAFIWGSALSRIKKTGKPLVTAGQICKMGRCTFEGMAAMKSFAKANPDFMVSFVKVLNETNRDFLDNPDGWSVGSKNINSVIRGLGGKADDALEEMRLYKYPSLDEQISCSWLGCAVKGGTAQTLKSTAEFLKQQGKIDTVNADYSGNVASQYAEAGLKSTGK